MRNEGTHSEGDQVLLPGEVPDCGKSPRMLMPGRKRPPRDWDGSGWGMRGHPGWRPAHQASWPRATGVWKLSLGRLSYYFPPTPPTNPSSEQSVRSAHTETVACLTQTPAHTTGC